MTSSGLPLPLNGLRILTVEQQGAGPYGTMQLADLGAEVIRIEDPSTGGDPARKVPTPNSVPLRPDDSLYFQSLNRNKKSVTLNLKSAEGQDILHALAGTAEAAFTSLRGDLPDKLGLTYRHLKGSNPRIVCVTCSGYGTTGPMASEPCYDYLIQARTGMMAITGEPDAPPSKSGLSVIDFASGLMSMVGLLSAVMAARRDGVGRDVNVSLFDTGLSLLNYLAIWTMNTGYRPAKLRRSQHPSMVPSGIFPTKDGWIVLAAFKDKFFERLCREAGLLDLVTDPRFGDMSSRLLHREELNGLLEDALRRASTDDWLVRLQGKLPCSPVFDINEALADPLVSDSEMVWKVNHPDYGDLREIASPIKMTDGQRQVQRRAPFLGEHQIEVLKSIEVGPSEIEELRKRGIV